MPSDKEREILTWAARGKTNWEIATILGLSPRTVEWYVKRAKAKLNASNITQAVASAMKRGVITPAWIANGTGLVAAMAEGALYTLQYFSELPGTIPLL